MAHLGTSPDRKVIERGEGKSPSYGLLEIKCPYLSKQTDGSYKLKVSHAYHYQIMGQLGLKGISWCDFFVKCEEDYHLERIHFDVAKWEQMKNKLDVFHSILITTLHQHKITYNCQQHTLECLLPRWCWKWRHLAN